MSAQSLIEEFRKLPMSDKIRVAQDLWEEIGEESLAQPLTEAQKRLLDARIRDHDENPGDVEPWEKVRDDILREQGRGFPGRT